MVKNRAHVVMALPSFLIMFFIMYVPMIGLLVAFKNYTYSGGIFGSEWAGLSNFKFLIASKTIFFTMTKNTLMYYFIFTLLGTFLNIVNMRSMCVCAQHFKHITSLALSYGM